MAQKIIDMRNRPAFLHDFFGATPGTAAYDTAKWLNQRLGSADPEHFRRSYTVAGYLQELDDAGIDIAVTLGRETPELTIADSEIAELVSHSPKLVGFGSVDIETRGVKDTQAAIEQAIKGYGFKAINIEPGFGKPARTVDDPLFDPVYEACMHYGVPVSVMSGPTTPDLDFAHPNAVARLARKHPQLNIICFHGYYPYVNEVIGAALRYSNLYLVPDMYIFQPGSQLYVQAANQFLQEQLLFASSYPFRALKQSVEEFSKLGFKDSVLENVFYGNAARLLKLNGQAG